MPYGLVDEILERRAYRHVRDQIKRAKKGDDLPDTPLADLYQDIEIELQQEKWRARLARQPGTG